MESPVNTTTELADNLEAIPTADMTLEDQKIFALGIDTLRKQAEELERCRTALRPFAKHAELWTGAVDDQAVFTSLRPRPDGDRSWTGNETIVVSDLRLARSAYNEPKQNGEAK